MKDSTLRIVETLNYIGNANVVTPAQRQHAHLFATAFVTNRYPAANAGQPAYETFSNAMSLGWHMRDDPNRKRHMKRAAYLLTRALLDVNGVSRIGCDPRTIGDASAETAFKDVLRKARIVSDSQAGRNGGSTDALNLLYNSPLLFLSTNKLMVNGSPVRDPHQGDQNVLQFHFTYELMNDRYELSAGAPPAGGYAVTVDSVTAMHWTDVPNSWNPHNILTGDFSQIPGIELASQFMVTTQFTGCAFCMKRHNGHVYCVHLAPKRSPAAGGARQLSGNELAREVAGLNGNVVGGDFANAAGGGPLAVYGAGFSVNTLQGSQAGYPDGLGGGGNYMTIVGLQRGPDYEIYSQVTQNHLITGAVRIF